MPAPDLLRNLLRYLVFEVQERGAELFRTRLVKLAYLVEVEFFRAMGRRLTNLMWVRYRFGPFAFELEHVTKSLGFSIGTEETDFREGRGIRYRLREDRPLYDLLPLEVRGVADRVIARWADEDLGVLLDYVYCDTEPMRDAAFNAALDFGKVDRSRRRTYEYRLDLPSEKVQAIRERVLREGSLSRRPPKGETDNRVSAAMVGIEGAPDLSSLVGKLRLPSGSDLEGPSGSE